MWETNSNYPPVARKTGHKAVRGLMITALLLVSLVAVLNMGMVQNVHGLDPHVVKGYCYEANGTALTSATVTILNTRTGESNTATSNATGYYTYNLLNLPSGWAYGDTIQINTTNATGSTGLNSTQLVIGTTYTGIDVWIGSSTAYSGISFYIIDEDGYPVKSALINVKDNSGDIVTTKMSDSDGKASAQMSDGLYTITVGKSGYDDQQVTVRVHGTNGYTVRLGEAISGVVLTDLYTWALLIFACIGIVALLMWIARKF